MYDGIGGGRCRADKDKHSFEAYNEEFACRVRHTREKVENDNEDITVEHNGIQQ